MGPLSRWTGLLCIAVSTVAFAQVATIDISGANFRPVPLAVAKPSLSDGALASASAEFDEALMFDLQASGLFQVLDRKSFLDAEGEGFAAEAIRFNRWADVGAEQLLKSALSRKGTQLQGELRVYSVAAQREDMRASLSVNAKSPRRLAHALVDALYKYFTRETGPFDSSITFVKKSGPNKDVFISDWDGRNALALTKGGINVLPTLVPGTLRAAYTSFRRGKPEIFVQAPGTEPQLVVSDGRMATGAAFTPDGRQLAYALSAGENSQIYVARPDGKNARALTKTPYSLNSSPSFSPKGDQIAFVSNLTGQPQIYVMAADGSGSARRLTFQGTYNQTPDWSPRGDLIAFTARDERNVFDVFVVEVATGKITRISQDAGNNEEPVFSPNGRLLLFSSTRLGAPHLFVSTLDGKLQNPLPMERGHYLTPDW